MRPFRLFVLSLVLSACATIPDSVPTRPDAGPAGPATPLIPLEAFARQPQTATAVLDPAGRRVALIETREGRGAVVLLDPASGERTLIHRNPDRSIDNIRWSPDGRWLYFFRDAGGDEGFHLFRLDPNRPQEPAIDLTPFRGVTVELAGQPRNSGPVIAIAMNRRDPAFPDAFRLDLNSGVLTEIARNDSALTEFFANDQAEVNLATKVENDGTLAVFARDGVRRPWRRIHAAPPAERLKVLRAGAGPTALVLSDRGAQAQRLSLLDLESGGLSRVSGTDCGRFDDEDGYLDVSGKLVLRHCVALLSALTATGSVAAAALEHARSLAGRGTSLSLESAAADFAAMIFYADSARHPGQFIMADRNGARVIGQTRPWLDPADLAPSTAQWVAARDGLPLLTYVTRPPDGVGPQPTIIALHGGPWSRDAGGFEATTQLLANRGYAVLQVNFRGSTGLGSRHHTAGVRQFGAAMSDDVVDAAQWAIREGIAEPGRICVMGGSYGGYATLVALSRDAELFACGIDYAGPTDLVTLMEAFPPSWQPFLPRSWYRFVGDPRKPEMRAEMTNRSPLHHIDRFRRPLLIFQGANDPRVTQAQSDAIVCALRRKGIAAEYLLAANEGHSFGNEETSLAVNRATEQFLAAQLGGRSQPGVEPRVDAALASLRAAGSAIRCPS